ncbi:MAG: hypothetical protein ACREGE_00380 [Candidatus Microsaccharimonas sp.]
MSLKSISKKNLARTGGGIAALGVAAALLLVPVSGADFSASDTGRVDVSTATLTLDLSGGSQDSGGFDLDFSNLKPGETQTQNFTVTNTGSIAANVSLGNPVTGISASIGNANANQLEIGVAGYKALTPAPQLASGSIPLGSLGANESRTYTLQVSLSEDAGNEWQGKTIGATATVTLNQR